MNSFEHFPAHLWPADEESCLGLELDWFCVDSEGHIGICSSAGQGPIPGIGFSIGAERHNRLLDAIASRPTAGAIPVYKAGGRLDDWHTCASHGLYAFDYQNVHRTGTKLKIGYDLLFRPEHPARLDALPPDLQLWLSVTNVVFAEIDFLPFIEVRH